MFGSEDRESAQILARKVIFAGHHMLQYCHLTTEELGSLYPMIKSIKFEHITFFPFIFEGSLLPDVLSEYHNFIFSSLVISLDKINLIRESARFDELCVPSPVWPINLTTHPVMSCIYLQIR